MTKYNECIIFHARRAQFIQHGIMPGTPSPSLPVPPAPSPPPEHDLSLRLRYLLPTESQNGSRTSVLNGMKDAAFNEVQQESW